MARYLIRILAVGALALGACGDDDDSSGADAPKTTASASAPYGTYVRHVTSRDLARTKERRDEYGPAQQLPPAGRYRLVIAKGAAQDVLKATDPGGFTVAMDVKPSDGVIRLTSYVDPAQAAFCGVEIPAQAAYRFDADGSTLALEATPEDPCADRDSILTGTWHKQ